MDDWMIGCPQSFSPVYAGQGEVRITNAAKEGLVTVIQFC